MPVPEIGQVVHLENVQGRLIVKAVHEDAQTVDLVTAHGEPKSFGQVPVADLLPGEDLSAG